MIMCDQKKRLFEEVTSGSKKRKRKEKEKKKKKTKTKGIPEPAVEEPVHLITFLVFFNRVLLRHGFSEFCRRETKSPQFLGSGNPFREVCAFSQILKHDFGYFWPCLFPRFFGHR